MSFHANGTGCRNGTGYASIFLGQTENNLKSPSPSVIVLTHTSHTPLLSTYSTAIVINTEPFLSQAHQPPQGHSNSSDWTTLLWPWPKHSTDGLFQAHPAAQCPRQSSLYISLRAHTPTSHICTVHMAILLNSFSQSWLAKCLPEPGIPANHRIFAPQKLTFEGRETGEYKNMKTLSCAN